MTIRFSPHEDEFPSRFVRSDTRESPEQLGFSSHEAEKSDTEGPQEKKQEVFLKRERLEKLLKQMCERFNTVLLVGRAGTGKTFLAKQFCREFEGVIVWHTLSSSEKNFQLFLARFSEKFDLSKHRMKLSNKISNDQKRFEELFSLAGRYVKQSRLIFVFDNLHKIYEAKWFQDFFTAVIYCVEENLQFLLIARSFPPIAIWRLRSKQMIGVVEEKNLIITEKEALRYLKNFGISKTESLSLYRQSFGKISRLKHLAETFSGKS